MASTEKDIKLTPHEKQVLELMAAGKLCAEIAEELGLKLQTIKWYRMRLREKFDATTSSEMIHKATEQGLL